ncbi:MAG: dienelactone hydrolase family protein [Mesorhizobium sp.]|nr:dienelactone hydrolase family protein [Mesorhizobium sp.]MCO5163323.1 dienelactone hydrolase family protein [Mesorhizobium sp.]
MAADSGTCPAHLHLPSGKPSGAAIILYMDAFGPRPAMDEMAARLAGQGHAVLVPDLFYRFGAYGPFDAKTAFSNAETGQFLRRMIAETTQAMTMADTGLFLDAPDSPAANAAKIKARVYVGVAGVDGSFPPEQSARFAQAFREAEVDHTMENYVGMKHGWCVPDHSVYDAAGAERHWKRLETLFGETLRG